MALEHILAATFTVIFEGLVAFVGDSATQKTHVAVVNAAGHEAYVLVNGIRAKLQKDDVVTFGLHPGKATTAESFDRRVPNLSEYVLAGDIHDDVKDQTHPNDGVLAFVTLSNGSLSAEGGFTHPAVFTRRDGQKDVRCIARSVRFEATAADEVTVTISGPSRVTPAVYTAPASSQIYVGNVAMTAGMHFHAFGLLLNRRGKLGSTSEDSSYCDPEGRVVEPPNDYVNKLKLNPRRFPVTPLLPNGDCGPVDNP